jgi:hypothetical protein
MTVDYWNRHTQTEKQEELEHDTYLSRAENALDLEAAGRFKQRQETRLTGNAADPIPQLPGGPWSSDYAPAIPSDPATDCVDYNPNFVEPILQPTPISTDAHPVVDPAVGSAATASVRASPDVEAVSAEEDVSSPAFSSTNSNAATASLHPVGDAVAAKGRRDLPVTPPHKSFHRRF